ncbi:MAG TPA: polysaccharide biosynthesis/export family protein [Candidatus Deferrimicrobiaceae bacterium]|jgi:polysaccharide export outer membrane protein|nr:polysaccharide biosynthesis/export family protein [Candidatus Deferrimicrobiaceae bacterium]
MKKVMKLACLAMLGFMAIGMWAQEDANAPKPAQPAVPEVRASAPGGRSDYIIGPDDTLRISVWKEPDMSVNLPVRPDGKISMPLLDDVQASGMTPMQLAGSIRDKLKKYIADPRVTVVVTAMNSQRIYVLGEVIHTGAMPLLPGMTVLQALSSAGFTQFANLKAIYLLRVIDGKQTKLPFNYKNAIKGRGMQQNVALKPGDTLVVP